MGRERSSHRIATRCRNLESYTCNRVCSVWPPEMTSSFPDTLPLLRLRKHFGKVPANSPRPGRSQMVRASFLFVLALLMSLSMGRPAFAELRPVEEAAAECDRLAASPLDDERKSAGVELDQIDVSRAIPACQDAVNAGNLRAMSHLARALLKKGDYPEAVRWLEKAAGNGNAVAMGNLGGLYVKGQGVPRDFAKGRGLPRLGSGTRRPPQRTMRSAWPT